MDTHQGFPMRPTLGFAVPTRRKQSPRAGHTSSASLPSGGIVVCAYPAGLGENNTAV